MAAILHSKRSDAPTDTSTLIEASTGVLDRRQGIGRLFGRVDPEGLREAPPAQRRDDYGVAALHPFDPAEIEAALGDRAPYHARDVWASLGPVEAESTEAAAVRRQRGKLDPELGEKTGACCRDFSDFVVEHDVFAGDERIGEIDAEAARKVVVANSGRTERPGLTGERAVSRSLLESDGNDPVDHGCHGRLVKPEIAMPPITNHRQHTRRCQLCQMRAGG